MTFYNRGGFSGGRGNNRQNFDDRGYDRPSMFKATCAECGKECEVPFRPNGSKPVFCSSCFEVNGGRGSDRPASKRFDRGSSDTYRRESSGAQPQNYRDEFMILNRKLDKIMDLLAAKQTSPKEDSKKEITKKIKKEIKESIEG